jgi:hypothetical protein
MSEWRNVRKPSSDGFSDVRFPNSRSCFVRLCVSGGRFVTSGHNGRWLAARAAPHASAMACAFHDTPALLNFCNRNSSRRIAQTARGTWSVRFMRSSGQQLTTLRAQAVIPPPCNAPRGDLPDQIGPLAASVRKFTVRLLSRAVWASDEGWFTTIMSLS